MTTWAETLLHQCFYVLCPKAREETIKLYYLYKIYLSILRFLYNAHMNTSPPDGSAKNQDEHRDTSVRTHRQAVFSIANFILGPIIQLVGRGASAVLDLASRE